MLNGQVLILNQDYQPLSVCNVRKSILLLLMGKAELLHDNPERKIHTVSTVYDFPSVIRLRSYARTPYRNIVLSRKSIMKRDGHKCQYCGSTEDLTIDHIIPKSRGGKDTWDNLVTACNRCNNVKGNRIPKEANMKLLREPYRPNHILYLKTSIGKVEELWKPYLYM